MSPSFRAVVRPFLIAITIAMLTRTLLVHVFAIPSGSMMPTLQSGDQVIVTPYRPPWTTRQPARRDVVVFRRTDGAPGFFVKRIVGLPGDHLELRDGRVLVDGYPIEESYVLSEPPGGNMAPEIVPADSYFVMGDHRADSIDSRVWGFVPRQAIVGRARLVFWSSTGDSQHRSADASMAGRSSATRNEQVRWRRILRPVN